MEFDAGTWWLIGILLTFLIGALGWMVKRSLDKIERKLDSAATKAELEKEVGECKQQISEIQHTYTTRSQHQQDWTECHNDIKAIQAINIIRHSYNRLTDVQQAAQIWGVSQDDFLDCINYLAMAKYIQLRTIADKILVPDFADIGWDLLEAKLTAEGISVLCHKTKDEMIEV